MKFCYHLYYLENMKYEIKQELTVILIINPNFQYAKSKSNNNCINIPFLKYFIYTNT